MNMSGGESLAAQQEAGRIERGGGIVQAMREYIYIARQEQKLRREIMLGLGEVLRDPTSALDFFQVMIDNRGSMFRDVEQLTYAQIEDLRLPFYNSTKADWMNRYRGYNEGYYGPWNGEAVVVKAAGLPPFAIFFIKYLDPDGLRLRAAGICLPFDLVPDKKGKHIDLEQKKERGNVLWAFVPPQWNETTVEQLEAFWRRQRATVAIAGLYQFAGITSGLPRDGAVGSRMFRFEQLEKLLQGHSDSQDFDRKAGWGFTSITKRDMYGEPAMALIRGAKWYKNQPFEEVMKRLQKQTGIDFPHVWRNEVLKLLLPAIGGVVPLGKEELAQRIVLPTVGNKTRGEWMVRGAIGRVTEGLTPDMYKRLEEVTWGGERVIMVLD